MSKRARLALSFVLLLVFAWALQPQMARADELAPAAETGELSYTPPSNPLFYVELKDENNTTIHIEPTWSACGSCEWAVGYYEFQTNRSYDTLVIRPANGAEEGTLPDWGETPPWYNAQYNEVLIWGTVHATTCHGMFMSTDSRFINERNHTDLSNLDTSQVTTMDRMFMSCDYLESIDLSSLDLTNVTNMEAMFYGCEALKTLSMGIDTPSLTNMNSMFECCTVLPFDQVPHLNTSNVTNMADLFSGCEAMTSIDLSWMDTSKVVTMSNMFSSCKYLESLDLSGLDVSSVEDMSYLFSLCRSLKSLDLSGFDTRKVEEATSMFDTNSRLIEVKTGLTYQMIPGSDMFPQEPDGKEWQSVLPNGSFQGGKDYITTCLSNMIGTYTLVDSSRMAPLMSVSDTSVKVGETASLGAGTTGSGELQFTSSDESVVTVDDQGNVCGVKVGSATITVIASGNDTWRPAVAFAKVEVTAASGSDDPGPGPDDPGPDDPGPISPALKAQTITATNKKVAMGKTVPLGAKTSGNGKLTYTSSNTKVAKVSSTGVITPVKPGKATITITAAATSTYKKATKKVTVTVVKGSQVITVANTSVNLGKSVSLGTKRSPGNGKLTYASSNKAVATVSAAGKVTPKKTGKVTITITAAATSSFKKATKKVTFRVLKRAQTITAANKTLTYGSPRPVGAKTSGNGKLSYKSSNTGVAKISVVKGVPLIVPVKAGAVTITITAAATSKYEKATKKIAVKVNKATQTITASNSEFGLLESGILSAKTSGDGTITFEQVSGDAAAVAASGVVVAHDQPGTTVVRVKASETPRYKAATKTINVKVGHVADKPQIHKVKDTVTLSYKTLQSKAQTSLNVTNKNGSTYWAYPSEQGPLVYSNASVNPVGKKCSVDAKTGKLTVPKGTAKGTYNVVVRATLTAQNSATYISNYTDIAFKVNVK